MAVMGKTPANVLLFSILFSLSCIQNVASQAVSQGTPQCIPNTLKISDKVSHRPPKLTIAHRGASYHLPEHTVAAYRLALEMRADYIEPDLVATADGELIALHTVDLNKTTNVDEIFSADRLWFSPKENRTGYWTFNFTYEELQQLTVSQRLPGARTRLYDGRFGIPRLTDILQALQHWNTVDLPQILPSPDALEQIDPSEPRKPNQLELNQAGIYIELKDAGWLLDEAGLDLVELLFQHLQDHSDLWGHLLQCYQEIRFDSFKVPGLVIQSFDGTVLKNVSDRWTVLFQDSIPQPPLILLVDHRSCWEDSFWFQVGDKWRDVISGIGCEKKCLLSPTEGSAVQEKAQEFDLVLHPWTERPEQKELAPGFNSALEETMYLFCKSGAQGIFSESISTAILAAQLGCDDFDKNESGSSVPTPAPAEANASSKAPTSGDIDPGTSANVPTGGDGDTDTNGQQGLTSTCLEAAADDSSSLTVGLASFAAGAVLSAAFAVYLSYRRKRRFGDGRVIPTRDVRYDLEMT